MVIGFTGTRRGMTKAQKRVVEDLLRELRPNVVVHGDCVGADVDFHKLTRRILPYTEIVLRPGCNARGESPTRAHCKGNTLYPVKPYLVRDEQIAKDCNVLIACPSSFHEQQRSGTWATIRMARRKDKYQYIVLPDGSLT